MSEKTIIRLDASALTNSACDLCFSNIVLDGYSSPLLYRDTQYGIAFHRFMYRMFITNGNLAEAHKAAIEVMRRPCIERDKKEYLTEKHLIPTCLDYWENVICKDSYKRLVDPNTNLPLVEVTFCHKLYEDDSFIVYLQGTIDSVGKIVNGAYLVQDFKTTSSWKIDDYLNSYRLSTQMRIYAWAVKQAGLDNPDGPFGPVARTNIGYRIDGIFLKGAKESPIYKSSEVFFHKEADNILFENGLRWQAKRIVELYKRKQLGYTPEPTGMLTGMCSKGFRCRFFEACAAPDPIARQHILNNKFEQKQYDPLRFHEDD